MPATRSPQDPLGAAPDRMVGRTLGDRYRVLSRIGEGGMGTVYLCEHAVLRRRFAVKVLRPDLAIDDELVDRFRNEAIAASRIGQENVVDVLDFGADEDGALYYVMEALDGRSLGAVIEREGPLDVSRALSVLEQVCRALAAAHARGVVHRDVKPDNVFLVPRDDGGERVKVIDFGISHVPPQGGAARITRAGSIIGTPEYMAPEQATGGAVDHRSDVYAVGVLAFEMLTGRLPFEADGPIATLLAHQTRTPEPPSRLRPGIAPEVDALVLRALAKRPEDRFESMAALAEEVHRRLQPAERAAAQPRQGPASGVTRPSRPRGETVSLPATPPASAITPPASAGGTSRGAAAARTDHPAARTHRIRQLTLALGIIAASAVAVASAWRSRPQGSTKTAVPAALAPHEAPPAPPAPAVPANASASPAMPSVPAKAAPDGARAIAKPPARSPRSTPAAPALKDPYGGAEPLKADPFE